MLSSGAEVKAEQRYEKELGHHSLHLQLPLKLSDAPVPVVVLQLDQPPQVDQRLLQFPEGDIVLQPSYANVYRAEQGSMLELDNRGVVKNWFCEEDWLEWEFTVVQPGLFDIVMATMTQKYNAHWNGEWEGGHEFELTVHSPEQGDKRIQLSFKVNEDQRVEPRDLYYYENVYSNCGRLLFEQPGKYKLSLRPKAIVKDMKLGPKLCYLRLEQINE